MRNAGRYLGGVWHIGVSVALLAVAVLMMMPLFGFTTGRA